MNTIPSRLCLLFVTLLPALPAATAAMVEQTAPFSASNAGQLLSGTGTSPLADGGIYAGTFSPFNAALGTLTACTVTFTATAELSGTADPGAGADASLSATLGGSFYLNGRAFNGTGGGVGPVTAVPGSPLTATLVVDGFSYTFNPASAGVSYDPAILGFITGTDAFPLEFRASGNTVTYANALDLAVSMNGVLRVTYEYTPAPAPPEITALVRQSATGDVTLTWTSTAGSKYAVDASPNLSAWTEVVSEVTAAAGSETSWTETSVPAATGKRFYRVRKK